MLNIWLAFNFVILGIFCFSLMFGFLWKIVYSNIAPNGSLKLYHFIAMVTVVMIVLSQLPTFHSLRHINLCSLFLSLGYTFLVVGACIHAGTKLLPLNNIYATNTNHVVNLQLLCESILQVHPKMPLQGTIPWNPRNPQGPSVPSLPYP